MPSPCDPPGHISLFLCKSSPFLCGSNWIVESTYHVLGTFCILFNPFFLFKIEVQLIYNILQVIGVQYNDSQFYKVIPHL